MDFARIFEGRALVKPTEAGAAIGWSKQYCRNLLSLGKFPFPTVEINGVKFCRVSDLDLFIQQKAVEAGIVQDAAGFNLRQGRRGRMTKLERVVQEKLAHIRSIEERGGEK
ncbi:MAG: hypothetical protein K6360_09320 [Deltaproteobacteria bacterium]